VKSVNVVPARLGRELGIKNIIATGKKMGLTSPLDTYPPMVLGTSGLTLIEQATGYNVFANGGFVGTRRAFDEIFGPEGNVVFEWSNDASPPVRALKEETVSGMNKILSQVPIWGTARRGALEGIISAGKTGTTQDYRDAWYIGYTGNFTMAVWAGNDNYTETNRMTGGSLPAMIWKRAMTFAHRDVTLKTIPYLEDMVVPEVEQKKPAEGETPVAEEFITTVKKQQQMTAELRQLLEQLRGEFKSASKLEATDTGQTASIRQDNTSAVSR
jgi:penicillin-binding protein 1A